MSRTSFGVWENIFLPTVTDGTNSQPFSVPTGAKSVTFIVPALIGAASTLLIEVQSPPVTNTETAVWSPLGLFDTTDGTREALDAIPEEVATVFPASVLGSGVLRFVASVAQTGAVDAFSIKAIWAFDK